ncbi:hypothetical protein DN752_12080 [Echinicola strongylocentroti]|uniref:DUF6787 domain-containing protein n=1 Tax=Echinicola strongylocentroti TaxID=1795355 RepID=A0A2Z4IIN4_9BACT|nr:DUF6787 family protein [Echinicola strongylocentroti]AWW30804.1 hypothetical protein DN752_12080 [Echinicola strongylocentroti]
MNEKGFLKRLQQKWQLKSIWQVLLVLLAFACTGFTVLFIKQPIFDLLGVDMSSGGFWKTVLYLLLILPLYQIMLLAYGFLFGQFSFFWEKEKKFFKRIGALFIRKGK